MVPRRVRMHARVRIVRIAIVVIRAVGGGGGGGVRILILSRLITIPRHRDVLVHHRLLQQPQRLRVWRHFAPASDFTRDGAKAHAICL